MARRRASPIKANRNERGGDGFWDRPMLINLLADLLLLAGGALLAWAGVMTLQRLPILPLKELVVATPVEHVSRAQIEHAARTALTGNFFTVNLDTARGAFERMPWVRSASLRRLWPDGVELQLEEHRAAARWTPQDGEARLVSTRGEVFAAASDEALPQFAGPEGSAGRVLERFLAFSEALAPAGYKPVAIHLSAREAWQLKLADGVLLELGREEAKHPLAERVDRFASHYAAAVNETRGRLPGIGVVDMRYPNGFALRGEAAPSPLGKGLAPPPGPRPALHSQPASAPRSSASLNRAYAPGPGAGVTSHPPGLAGEAGKGGCQCQAHGADAVAEAA